MGFTPCTSIGGLCALHYSIDQLIGLGNAENLHCDNCNKRQCDYCGDIALECHNKRIRHHPTCVLLVKIVQASSE